MCLANKFLTKFEQLADEVENEYSKLKQLQSLYDKKLSEHYHKVETSKFNAAEGFYLAKELQDITRQRRMIKQELYKLTNLRQTLKFNAIVDRTHNARKSLSKLHKNEEQSEWYKDWKDNYRVEDLQIH